MGKTIAFLFGFLMFFLGSYIYLFSSFFLVQPTASQNNQTINFNQSFKIEFPTSVNKDYYAKQVILKPSTGMQAILNDEKNKITLTPTSIWKENTQYKVTLPQGRTRFYQPIQETSFYFKTSKYPNVISVTPENDAKEITIDSENPIRVEFDQSTENFDVSFDFEPEFEKNYTENENRTIYTISPEKNLEEGAEHTLNIKLKPKDLAENQFKSIYSTSFTTLLPIPVKALTWKEQLTERVKQAQKNSQPIISKGKYIDINTQNQVLIMFENGKNLGTFLISSGRPGMNTPKGTWKVLNKNPRKWSQQYKLYMPYWMAITSQGHGIHELPEYPNGYKEGTNSLGLAVSHGCVRLGVGNAKKVFDWAEIGTTVIVH